MRISHKQEILISSGAKIHRALKEIGVGSQISAEVIQRIDANRGVINMRGHKIIAQFVSGVPQFNNLELVFVAKRNDAYVFRMVSSLSQSSQWETLQKFIGYNELQLRQLMHPLRSLLLDGRTLYNINKILSGWYDHNSQAVVSPFLNALLKRGIEKKDVERVGTILMRLKSKNPIVRFVLNAIQSLKNKNHFYEALSLNDNVEKNGSDFEQANFLSELLSKIEWDDELKNDYHNMISWIFKIDGNREEEIPIYDENCYLTAWMIVRDNFIALCCNFSNLGYIELFGLERQNNIILSLVCNLDKSVEILTKELHNLHNSLFRQIKKSVYVDVISAKKVGSDILRACEKISDAHSFDVQA